MTRFLAACLHRTGVSRNPFELGILANQERARFLALTGRILQPLPLATAVRLPFDKSNRRATTADRSSGTTVCRMHRTARHVHFLGCSAAPLRSATGLAKRCRGGSNVLGGRGSWL